jgi:CspA family cold shock protein
LARCKGLVKWFNNAEGYGFLGIYGGVDVFCHYSAVMMEGYKSLKEGDEVEFDIMMAAPGTRRRPTLPEPQTHSSPSGLLVMRRSVVSASGARIDVDTHHAAKAESRSKCNRANCPGRPSLLADYLPYLTRGRTDQE